MASTDWLCAHMAHKQITDNQSVTDSHDHNSLWIQSPPVHSFFYFNLFTNMAKIKELSRDISDTNVSRAVNQRKAAGPDRISGRMLKAWAVQLAPVFTIIQPLPVTCHCPSLPEISDNSTSPQVHHHQWPQ